jgi:carboxylate-amine ligase
MADDIVPLTLGIEEEYLLVDPASRDLAVDPPAELMRACEAALDADAGAVSPEFLRAQIEVGTTVCHSIGEAREKLASLRRTVIGAAEEHGLALIAASTHPFADWHVQQHTDKERYNVLARDMATVAQRLLICGMHVHVGIPDDDLRIDLMNQVRYFLPHLLVLTTSSPFWQGYDTGMLSYRLSVFDELPRTGTPGIFESHGEYQRHIAMLVGAGLIEDASKIWWDVRPSARFPTLEMRIADVCTRMDDGITVAALYASLLAMLQRLRRGNQRWRVYAGMLIDENRWRAQRYGFSEGLVDFGRGAIVGYPELLEEMIAMIGAEADVLGCRAEVERARDIVSRGTSAHRQRAVYEEARLGGADSTEAMRAVVDWLIAETKAGL